VAKDKAKAGKAPAKAPGTKTTKDITNVSAPNCRHKAAKDSLNNMPQKPPGIKAAGDTSNKRIKIVAHKNSKR